MKSSRRHFLNSLSLTSGAVAFAPFLRALDAHAAGDMAALPKRFVFVVKSSGLDRLHLVPPTIDSTFPDAIAYNDANVPADYKRTDYLDLPLADHTLPDILTPFNDIKSKLTIVQGLSGKNFDGNHTAGLGALSCHNSEKIAIAPTLDYILGAHHSQGPYAMYAMAMNGSLLGQNTPPENGYCYPNISAKGKGQSIPFQASPEKAFLDLFGSAVMPAEEARKKLTVQSNLMDFLKDDAARINAQLTAEERDRFAHYTNAFESLRVRESKKTKLAPSVREHAPEFTNLYTSQVETDRQECQFNIATAAMISGLTNVVTLRPDTLGTVYTGLGIKATGLHAIGHGKDADNGWTAAQTRKAVNKHHLELVAGMAHTLDKIPEGDGTMLDNTLIVYTSCAGGSHHGGQDDWPFVLVGGTGGKLKSGRYLQFPSYQQKNHKTIANLYLAILQAAGLQAPDRFGQEDPGLKDLHLAGPLSELLT